MRLLSNIDYLGDAVLRIISMDAKVPPQWKWHRDADLAALYDAIFPMTRAWKVKKFFRLVSGCSARRVPKNLLKVKASLIEFLLGEAFMRGGIEEARRVFKTMLAIANMSFE